MPRTIVIVALAVCVIATVRAQEGPPRTASRKLYDEILDGYVRDGYVYYRALKLERAKLDAYVASLSSAPADTAGPGAGNAEQIAFWLNAYNAIVLRTVIDHYPIAQRSTEYPPHSIRQIPGAFERAQHRVAGRTLTLDQIEQTVLQTFHDPRLYLALGRGAVGGGRLRSEAFAPDRIEVQLKEVADECVSRPQCIQIDREANKVSASAIFSWREKDFVTAYAESAPASFASRSPIERAVLALVQPKLLTAEREFVAQNQFQLVFKPFDWTLNDLTGRGR
jgi:hypothetical protein